MESAVIAEPRSLFNLLTDDVLLAILAKLESDPRHWARLSCTSSRFASLIHDVCCREKCTQLNNVGPGSGGWAALYRLTVCCPGLDHAGVLLDNSDFGLELDIGPNHIVPRRKETATEKEKEVTQETELAVTVPLDGDVQEWTMFDDLYSDAVYDLSESEMGSSSAMEVSIEHKRPADVIASKDEIISNSKRKKHSHSFGVHLDGDSWTQPSRQEGSKLLNMRFRNDCLYILPEQGGCVHKEEKREYTLFRGVFKDFKKTGVWRNIIDCGKQKSSHLGCAFCRCKQTWDLNSTFCLRRTFGYHDNGEPVVRAFVCENGHVSGARTIDL